MNHTPRSQSLRILAFALAAIALSTGLVSAGPAQFVIVNLNAPNVGFNDPTPAAPVGGNTGTTLGEQRRSLRAARASGAPGWTAACRSEFAPNSRPSAPGFWAVRDPCLFFVTSPTRH